jgi:hypothetical protein
MDAGSHQVSSIRARAKSWLLGRGGSLIAAVLLAAVGGVFAAAESPLWWFGAALLASSASLFWRLSAPERERAVERLAQPRPIFGLRIAPLPALAELLCLAVIVLCALTMMRDLLGGERPVSHDHTVHYMKAWLLHDRFLPRGQLYGWSQTWFAGYPVSYLYPPGADLWINAVHALGFGALDFGASYAVAFVLFHVFTGYSVYRFGKVIGGRAVGLLAALLSLTDLAFFRMGGWNYTVEWGVWPQTLSLAFSLMALCSLPGIALGRGLAPLGAFGIWMGLAIITHPMQLVFLGLLVATCALAAVFAAEVRAATAMFRMGIGCVLALLCASLWLIPFLSSRSETSSMGLWWDTTYEIGKGLLDLQVFPGTLGYVLAFGILGLIAMLGTGRFGLLFVALTGLCIPAVTNSTFVDEFHLTTLAPALNKIQFVRLSIMVKPFWFVLAAYVLCAVVVRGARLLEAEATPSESPRSLLRGTVFAAVVSLLCLPFLVPASQAFYSKHVRKALTTESERQFLYDRSQLEHWLLHEMPRDGFFRVGVFTGHNHDLLDLGTLIDRPIFKRGFTPVSNFIYQMTEKDSETLEAVNLRFAISKVKLTGDLFEPVANFGIYTVYRFTRWQPQPFQIIEGQGEVRLSRFGDEEIALSVLPGAQGKLRLNVSYFSRWRAYRDGQRVPMTLTYLREHPDTTGFMTVKMVPGDYRFVFERTWGDRLAVPIGVAALLLCGWLIVADRRSAALARLRAGLHSVYRRLDTLSDAGFRKVRVVLVALGGTAVLGAGVALSEWRPPLSVQEFTPLPIERVRYDFLEQLSRARVAVDAGGQRGFCRVQGDRHVCRDATGNFDIDKYVASTPATLKEYILTRCVRARPVQDGLLTIQYPSVPMGDAIVGYFGIEREGRLMFKRRPVEFTIAIDGETKYEGQTQGDNKIHWFDVKLADLPQRQAKVTFSVRANNISKRYFCFNAQMIDERQER